MAELTEYSCTEKPLAEQTWTEKPSAEQTWAIPISEMLDNSFSIKCPIKDKTVIEPNIIEITCVTLTGAQIVINIDETKTLFNLKQYIYKKTDIMVDDQQLVYNKKSVVDTNTLQSYNIKSGDRIHLVCRLRGGMFHSTSSRADFVSLNFTMKFQKGSKMIDGLRKYGVGLDTLLELEKLLHKCETDEQIDKIYALIESVYIS